MSHLDRLLDSADDRKVIYRSRTLGGGHRALSSVLVIALLSFAHACAASGGVCDVQSNPVTSDHCSAVPDHDGCGDQNGRGDTPGRDCGHASICCSTWEAGLVTPQAPPPQWASLAFEPVIPSLGPSDTLATALVPIPSESPPPLISILRL